MIRTRGKEKRLEAIRGNDKRSKKRVKGMRKSEESKGN